MDSTIVTTFWQCGCGRELTHEHLVGNVLRCPACGSIMFVQGDLTPQKITRLLYESKFNDDQATELGKQTAIKNFEVKKPKHIKVESCTLKYYPILDIKEKGGQQRHEVHQLFDNKSAVGVDFSSLKLDSSADNAISEFQASDYITATLNEPILIELYEKYGTDVIFTIKYVPIYTWVAQIKKINSPVVLYLDASQDLPLSMQQNTIDATPGKIDLKKWIKIISELLFWGVALYFLVAKICKDGMSFESFWFMVFWIIAVIVGLFFKSMINPLATIVFTLLILFGLA